MAKNEPANTPAIAGGTLELMHEGAIPNSDKGIGAIIDLTRKSLGSEVIEIDVPDLGPGLPKTIPLVVDMRTGDVGSIKSLIEEYRTVPAAKTGIAKALTLASFIDMVNRHKTEHSAVFANTDWKAPNFQAVIDYHSKQSGGPADNQRHRIRYEFPLSEEWKAWVAANGKPMEQGEFAAFIEDRIADLSAPTVTEKNMLEDLFSTTVATPAQIVQLSRGLSVNVASTVKNVVTLQTGEAQIVFDEQHLDSDGKPLKVPGIFLLGIAPFFMGEKISIPVRLRYRKVDGKLVWFFQLYRPDQHVTERVRDDLNTVETKAELPTFEGSPEA